MRVRASTREAGLLALLTLAACENVPTGRPFDASAPADSQNLVGWIVGRDGEPLRVIYDVYKGHALWQGDIDLGLAQLIARTPEALVTRQGPQRGAVIDGAEYRWPNGRVPYVVDPSLQSRVDSAIGHVEARIKGLDFVPRTSEGDYLSIIPDDSVCSSFVGRLGAGQLVRLAPGCGVGSTVHELTHALGLFHEHTRCDRDTFVEILWGNIEQGSEDNFYIHCDDASDYLMYDEGSIMHYGRLAFTGNGQPTIRSLRGLDGLMGQRDSLGVTDKRTVRSVYPYWLAAGISGEQFIVGEPAEYTWVASAGGGTPPYHFTWWIDRSDPWGDTWDPIPEGDGTQTLTMYIDRCDGPMFALRVVATDSDPYGSYDGTHAPFIVENWVTTPQDCSGLTVWVSGPQSLVGDPGQFTWVVGVDGGTGPYAYTWCIDRTEPYGDSCESVGDGTATLTMYVDKCAGELPWVDGNFALTVRAVDSGSPRSGNSQPFGVQNMLNSPEWCP